MAHQQDQGGEAKMKPPPTFGVSYVGGSQQPAGHGGKAPHGKRWSYQQLKATDGIVPLQSGTNRFASQKGDRHFGTPRDVNGRHLHRLWEDEQIQANCEDDEALRWGDRIIRAQAGSNRFASQRGSAGFGAPRDVVGAERHGRFWQFGVEGDGGEEQTAAAGAQGQHGEHVLQYEEEGGQ